MTSSSKFEMFQIIGWPPGLFGEIYAIAAASEQADLTYRGEYFLFTQRPTPRLKHGSFELVFDNVPPDLLSVDLDYAIEEGRHQAEIALTDLLDRRTEEIGRPDLLGLNVSLSASRGRPFVSCWIRNMFRDEIRQVAALTQVAPLKEYLGAVTKISFSIRGTFGT